MKMWVDIDKGKAKILERENYDLCEENEELSRDVHKFNLLRKVFGVEQMDKVIERTTEIERANRRDSYLNGRER